MDFGPDGRVRTTGVSFGIDTNTFLGVLSDEVHYNVKIDAPRELSSSVTQARIVADTGDQGFSYGDRLVYDWVFTQYKRPDGAVETEVVLNLFVKVKSVLYLPVWAALQRMEEQSSHIPLSIFSRSILF